jgi:uncharacterized membrane protein YcgQ (UPF0703/DUF1980 family)
MTCCAVDARPIGVPVYQPNWRNTYKADQWVDVQGTFIQNPEAGAIAVAIGPKSITPISEPDNPYVY